ncbi:MAG: thioredoxin family protein [Proteobacteria bacterium]|jgi:thioredoxin-related protein|nr:thioredoxin family protein [Pseudomonadota bacterium]
MMLTRNLTSSAWLLFIALLLTGLQPSRARAESLPVVHVQESSDLLADGQVAKARQVPILIMFSMHQCPYCTVVREEFLKPMLRNKDYADKVIIREVHTDNYSSLRDFNGQLISPADLGQRYNASLAPTVVFVDGQGRELAKRLVGITTVDYYGGFLDDAIATSLQRLRRVVLNQVVE